MINTIKKIVTSLNVYSLYFVTSFWLKDGHHSTEYKIGSSLTILLIINFSWIRFIYHQVQFNWKATLFFVCCYHILIHLFFNRQILDIVNNEKSEKFKRYYYLFILYLVMGCVFFLSMYFFIDVRD